MGNYEIKMVSDNCEWNFLKKYEERNMIKRLGNVRVVLCYMIPVAKNVPILYDI